MRRPPTAAPGARRSPPGRRHLRAPGSPGSFRRCSIRSPASRWRCARRRACCGPPDTRSGGRASCRRLLRKSATWRPSRRGRARPSELSAVRSGNRTLWPLDWRGLLSAALLSAAQESLADGIHAPGVGIPAGLRHQAVRRHRLAGYETVVPKPTGLIVEEALPAIVAINRHEQDRAGIEVVVARRLRADDLLSALGPQAVGQTATNQAAQRQDGGEEQPDKQDLPVVAAEPAGGRSDGTHEHPGPGCARPAISTE